jgi:integration host factor subunit beta
VTKSDLIHTVASRPGSWTRRDAEDAVNTIFEAVAKAMRRGDRVEIRGLGSFGTKMRLPRVGRNPKTGDRVEIPAQRVPSFTAGKHLKSRVQP